MTEKKKKELYVRVKDAAGNDFICLLDELKDPRTATEEELSNCVDDATTQRYSGNIDVAD